MVEKKVTRVVALGPANFLCGLSKGGVLRVRPGLARPCLLAPATSVLMRGFSTGFSTIKRMGVSRSTSPCQAVVHGFRCRRASGPVGRPVGGEERGEHWHCGFAC